MFVSTETIRSIAKTLPIGYYAGREIPVEIDETAQTSFYSPIEDKIWVAVNNVQNSMKDTEFEDADQIETDIRTFLYHELSHAILTPMRICELVDKYPDFKKIMAEINVIEDERIETLMANYYMNVDFESAKARLNDIGGSTPFEKFFDLVRFGIGDPVFVQRLDDILFEFRGLTRRSRGNVLNYLNAIQDFVLDFYKDQEKNQDGGNQDNRPQDNSNDNSDSDNNRQGNSNDNPQGTQPSGSNNGHSEGDSEGSEGNNKSNKIPNNNSGDAHEDEETQQTERSKFTAQKVGMSRADSAEDGDVFKAEVDAFSEYLEDATLTSDLRMIFNSASKVRQMNSSAVNSYSGKFDPRSVARKDYRYFVQQNRSGSAKGYSKVHLNLFLDRSGSFCNNVQITNQILRSLSKIAHENPDFSYTVISCGDGETIEDTRSYMHRAYDGTCISKGIFETVKRVQAPDAMNYNIVLYDGQAIYKHAYEGQDGWAGNFAAFNSPNFLVITDPGNEGAVKYCPSARVVVTKKYTEELKKNLIKMLGIITR